MKAYKSCSKCGTLVLADRMADHWIIERHYSTTLPAVRVAPDALPVSRSQVMRAFHSRGNVS